MEGLTCSTVSYCEFLLADWNNGAGHLWDDLVTQYSTNFFSSSPSWNFDDSYRYADGGSLTCATANSCFVYGLFTDYTNYKPEYYGIMGGGTTPWTETLTQSPLGPPPSIQFSGVSDASCEMAGPSLVCYGLSSWGIVMTANGGGSWMEVAGTESAPGYLPDYPASSQSESCPGPNTCYYLGVAWSNNPFLTGSSQVYATTTGGASWVPDPMGVGAQSGMGTMIGQDLSVIACPSQTECIAAGNASQLYSTPTPLVDFTTDGGQHWNSAALEPPSTFGTVSAVGCPTTTLCVIGGSSGSFAYGNPLGTGAWTVASSPSSSGAATSISCPSVSACYATTSSGSLLYSSADLSSWSAATVSGLPSQATIQSLSSVTCTSVTWCLAVGKLSNAKALILSGSGSTWAVDSSAPSVSGSFQAASCASQTQCEVISSTQLYEGSPGSWSQVSVAGLPSGDNLYSVACGGPDSCYAVGMGTQNPQGSVLLSDNGISGPLDGVIQPWELYGGSDPSAPCMACYLESLGGAAADFAGDPVDTMDGDLTESVPLVSIPSLSPGFGLTLTYDAQMAQAQVEQGASSPGPFGWGWTGSNAMSIVPGPEPCVAGAGPCQVTVDQENGSQVIFNDNNGVFTPLDSHRVTATLSQNPSTGSNPYQYTFTRDGGQEVFTFASSGPGAAGTLVSQSDANANTTTYGSEAPGATPPGSMAGTPQCPTSAVSQCSWIMDSAKRVITLAVASGGSQVTAVIDPAGNTWALGYDGSGNLTSISAPETGAVSHVTSYGYDSANPNPNFVHDLTQITGPNAQSAGPDAGDVTENAYDPFGRVYCQITPADYAAHGGLKCPAYGGPWSAGMTMFSYNANNESSAGGYSVIEDDHGNKTQETYAYGMLVSRTVGYGTPEAATTT